MQPGLREKGDLGCALIRNQKILLPYSAPRKRQAIPVRRLAGCVRRTMLVLAAVVGVMASEVARANEIAVRDVSLTAAEEGIGLRADFDVTLTSRLENALHTGVALYFTTEFECARPRWYWLDDRIASVSRSTRVSYHALTRTYRLSTGTLHQSFPTLGEALRVLGRVRHWVVLEYDQLLPETTYTAAARMRLDVSQLPKPFQVSALANREWTLASDWVRWEFVTPAGGTQAGAR